MTPIVKVTFAAGLAAMAFGLLAYVPGSLTINGNTVSTDVVTLNNRTYVPIADVAKALNLVVSKDGTNLKLTAAGGANQVEGLNGKVGDQLNCGEFLFKVASVTIGDVVPRELTSGDEHAYGDGNTLVAVRFHVKNATKFKQSIDVLGGSLTSLTDDQEHSYTTTNFDGKREGEMLPGAACEFILIYQVPKSYSKGDMVYQLHAYSSEHGYKDYTFRVSLKDS